MKLGSFFQILKKKKKVETFKVQALEKAHFSTSWVDFFVLVSHKFNTLFDCGYENYGRPISIKIKIFPRNSWSDNNAFGFVYRR